MKKFIHLGLMCLATFLTLVALGCREKEEEIVEGVQLLDRLQYGEREVFDLQAVQMVPQPLMMDIVGSRSLQLSRKRPLVVYFHGLNLIGYNADVTDQTYLYDSFWADKQIELILDYARNHGAVVALVDYIVGPIKHEGFSLGFAKFPLCANNEIGALDSLEQYRGQYFMMSQAKEAIRFLKHHADKYNIDPENVTVMGYSAGGILAASGFVDDALPMPSYALEQSPVLYDSAHPYPVDATNLLIFLANVSYHTAYPPLPSLYPVTIPRPDLGPINGPTTYAEDASVKNIVLLNSGVLDLSIIDARDPRLVIYGNDQDGALLRGNQVAADPCTNKERLAIFNEIKAHAETNAGYRQTGNDANLLVLDRGDGEHSFYNFSHMETIWEFLQ